MGGGSEAKSRFWVDRERESEKERCFLLGFAKVVNHMIPLVKVLGVIILSFGKFFVLVLGFILFSCPGEFVGLGFLRFKPSLKGCGGCGWFSLSILPRHSRAAVWVSVTLFHYARESVHGGGKRSMCRIGVLWSELMGT